MQYGSAPAAGNTSFQWLNSQRAWLFTHVTHPMHASSMAPRSPMRLPAPTPRQELLDQLEEVEEELRSLKERDQEGTGRTRELEEQ